MPPLLTRVVNPFVTFVLRSRLHGLLSGALLLVTYTGRRTGRACALPVQYARDGERLLVLVAQPDRKVWWRNFDGAPHRARVRERGRDVGVLGRVLRDPQEIDVARKAYLARFPQAATAADSGARLVELTREHGSAPTA